MTVDEVRGILRIMGIFEHDELKDASGAFLAEVPPPTRIRHLSRSTRAKLSACGPLGARSAALPEQAPPRTSPRDLWMDPVLLYSGRHWPPTYTCRECDAVTERPPHVGDHTFRVQWS